MTKKELESIKKNKRLPVTFEDFYSRYFFILFPIGILFISYTTALAGFKNNVTNLYITAIIIGSIGLFLTVFIAVRLYQNQMFVNFIVQDVTKEKIDFALTK